MGKEQRHTLRVSEEAARAGKQAKLRLTRTVLRADGQPETRSEVVQVTIPPGTGDGWEIRFPGLGDEVPGREIGDAVFVVAIKRPDLAPPAPAPAGDTQEPRAQLPVVPVLNYSKWDHIEDSDEEEAEVETPSDYPYEEAGEAVGASPVGLGDDEPEPEAEPYEWNQAEHEVIIVLPCDEGTSSSDFRINFTRLTLSVLVGTRPVIVGDLQHPVKSSECFWVFQPDDRELTVTLVKEKRLEVWTAVLKDLDWRLETPRQHAFTDMVKSEGDNMPRSFDEMGPEAQHLVRTYRELERARAEKDEAYVAELEAMLEQTRFSV